MEEKYLRYVNRNRNINRGYRKLDVWNEGIDLFAYEKSKLKSLNQLSFKVKAQIEDSALSVPSNIAEGYSRRFLKENIQFNSIALSSMAENYTQMFALFRADEINEEWFDSFDNMHYSLENKLINLNRSYIAKLKIEDNWENDYMIKEMVKIYGEQLNNTK